MDIWGQIIRGSFRKIPKGGQKHVKIHFGGACVYSDQNSFSKGENSQGGGGGTNFSDSLMEQLHVDVMLVGVRHVGAESGHKTATSLLFCSRLPSSFYRLLNFSEGRAWERG